MPIVSDSKTLKTRLDALKKEPFIAIDTEFMRERTYFPILCLVQIAGEHDAFAIDAMAEGIDLSPLFALLKNRKIVKVFHAADQDIEILYKMAGFMPFPIFDSQIAAQVLGYGEAVGYGNLVKMLTGANIDKSSRFTDWSHRPLSPAQIEYALADVTHLRHVYEKLASEIQTKKRGAWFAEEMEDLVNPEHYDFHPEHAWKRFKVRHASPSFLGILAAVAEWRERAAQERNVPRGRIVRDEGVLEIAAARPATREDLQKLRHLHHSVFKERVLSEGLIAAIEIGLQNPAPKQKNNFDFDKDSALLELLRVLLKAQCEAHGVARVVVANDDDLKRIAHFSEADLKESDIRAMHGWRYTVFGDSALRLKRGEIGLTATRKKVEVITLDALMKKATEIEKNTVKPKTNKPQKKRED